MTVKDTKVATFFEKLVTDLKRDGETRVNLSEAPVEESVAKQMLESAAYSAGFGDKITIRKRKGALVGKLDRD